VIASKRILRISQYQSLVTQVSIGEA